MNKRQGKIQLASFDDSSIRILLQFIMKQAIESKIIEQRQQFRGKWLGLKYVDFSIGDKVIKNYEKIFRTTSKPNQIDGVDIIPILRFSQKKAQLLMIIEYRAPLAGYTLEFPTGMCESTDYEQNAARQLREETGFIVSSFTKLSLPVTSYDPWKSDETGIVFIANINGDLAQSYTGQQLESNQNIKTVKFELDDKILENITDYSEKNNLHIEAKVGSLALGIYIKSILEDL